ncbi:hypothetical protein BDV93DRAFT_601334 [Ceratobasidium sp. AG-I]|nr:hypothetical protein BDV93DRAFT_601334 [Ceratobasidium sp. AG-I]
MDRVFRSAADAVDHVSIPIPTGAFTSEVAMPLPLQVVSAGFRVPPVGVAINMAKQSFPTGIFSAEVFCSMISSQPVLQRTPIIRVNWMQKDSWPLYHQYLVLGIIHHGRPYDIRIETLGKVDRSRMVVQALGLNAIGPGPMGNAKFQVQVSDSILGFTSENDPPANLIASMATVDDPTFHHLEQQGDHFEKWCFTSVAPPDFSETESRESPTLGHICQLLLSIVNRAQNYLIESQNCYFLCHMMILGLVELCAPLPRLTWTLHALYQPAGVGDKIPWHLKMRKPASRAFRPTSCILYVDGRPVDHLRAIVVDGWGLCGVSILYQGSNLSSLLVSLGIVGFVPVIVYGALRSRKALWVACTVSLVLFLIACVALRRVADMRWWRTLDQLKDTESLVLKDVGLPPRMTPFTLRDRPFLSSELHRFPAMGGVGVSHAMLASDSRRLLRLQAHKKASAQRKLLWTIAGDHEQRRREMTFTLFI